MKQTLNISDAAAIGMHSVCLLAAEPDRVRTATDMATVLQVSEAHLAKVLQRLVRAGLVHGRRGPGGGFRLAVDPAAVSMLAVYEAIEGPMHRPGCMLGLKACHAADCPFRPLVERADELLRSELSGISLASAGTVFSPARCRRAATTAPVPTAAIP